MNISKREIVPIRGPCPGDRTNYMLNEFITWDQKDLVESLLVPYPSPQVVEWLNQDTIVPPGRRGLLSLSPEIITKIVADVYGHGAGHEARDILNVAATCKRLAQVAEHFVQEIRTKVACRWGGSRIICIGEGATLDRLPPRLLRESERERLRCKRRRLLPHRSPSTSCEAFGSLGLLGEGQGLLDAPPRDTSRPDRRDAKEETTQLSEDDRRVREELMRPHYPHRRDWIICNWSKREYVRAQAIADLCGRPDDEQPFLPNCAAQLSHALLARICWTDSDECMGIPSVFGFDLHRGPWAGDRFTITTMERLREDERDDWRDVSAEVVEEVRELLTAEGYGEQLRRPRKRRVCLVVHT
ncbi:hypothetical protein OH77DRAFT_1416497, partial [Trametes cingulata]